MKERIQKILAASGVASRRAAEELIKSGRVSCNGKICELGESADLECDLICLDGQPIPTPGKRIYLMLNKPRGYVTTMSDERGRKDVSELVKDCLARVYPVGRLDMDSEGLLLFTNDGTLANILMHPRHEVNKVYRVWVTGYDPAALEKLKNPIVLDGYQIKKPGVKLVQCDGDNAELLVTIHEGRNRQVRRMCAASGMTVVRLIRVQEGGVKLGNLRSGKWRYLTEEEVYLLLND